MRVLLISANRTEINMRSMPLGLACVAQASKREGHTVVMLDLVQAENPLDAIIPVIQGFDPELIGISIRNIDDQSMRNTRFFFDADNQVISLVRQLSRSTIVLGGAGYSLYPEAILAASEADIGVEGEGEAVFNMVLERLENQQALDGLPGVHVKGRGLMAEKILMRDHDAFALPDPDLMLATQGETGDLWIPVQTRRGCPMGCSYCSTGTIEGTITRKRSVKNVLEWIRKIEDRGINQFYFVDNTFNLPPTYAMALCRELTRVALKLKWRCIIYPFKLDELLVEAMAQAGCFEAAIGFESGDDHVLEGMNKRFRREDVARSCSLLRQHGIRRMGFLLLGGPGETRESVEASLAFADSLGLESMRVTIGIRIYPGTVLARQARKEGMISSNDDLLLPRFYITPGLEDEIRESVKQYAAMRPNWIV